MSRFGLGVELLARDVAQLYGLDESNWRRFADEAAEALDEAEGVIEWRKGYAPSRHETMRLAKQLCEWHAKQRSFRCP